MLMKLRQAALHPSLVKADEDDQGDENEEETAKMDQARTEQIEHLRAEFEREGSSFTTKAMEAFVKGEFTECGEWLVSGYRNVMSSNRHSTLFLTHHVSDSRLSRHYGIPIDLALWPFIVRTFFRRMQ